VVISPGRRAAIGTRDGSAPPERATRSKIERFFEHWSSTTRATQSKIEKFFETLAAVQTKGLEVLESVAHFVTG